MNFKTLWLALLILVVFIRPAALDAQEQKEKSADTKASESKSGDAKSSETKSAEPKEESSVTDHTLTITGQAIPYKATASTTLLKDEKDEPPR
jgi:hypothetical protein